MAKMILSNTKDSFEIESEGTLHELLGLIHMAEIELRCRIIGIIKSREEKFAEQSHEPDKKGGSQITMVLQRTAGNERRLS